MARNGSGTYTSPVNSWNPQVNGALATAPDFNAQLVDIANALTQSVSADGQTPITGNINMNGNKLTNLAPGANSGDSLRWQQLFSQGIEQDIASAATTDIGIQNTSFLRVTGTTSITSFGTNYNGPRYLRFSGILTLTYNSTTLLTPGSLNITTAPGDICIVTPKSTVSGTSDGWQVLAYQQASTTIGSQIQSQLFTAFTTAGTSTAYTLTPTPAITALAPNQRLRVKFNAANTTSTPTLNVSALGAIAIKLVDSNGTKIDPPIGIFANNSFFDFEYDGTNWVCLFGTPSVKATQIQLSAVIPTTSGTSIDFIGIGAWAKRVTINFNGVSTNGTNTFALQMGTSGGIQTNAYSNVRTITNTTGSATAASSTGYFEIAGPSSAASSCTGQAILTLLDATNGIWVLSSQLGDVPNTRFYQCAGSKPLSGILDRIRLTTSTGTDTFDAGSINVTYE